MISTIDEARRFFVNLLPPGHDDLYDETPGSDPFLFFDAIGESFKTQGFDLLEALRSEIPVPSMQERLLDWEKATGITGQLVALFGDVEARRKALIGKLRESGPFADPVVASIFSSLFGYFPTTPVEIMKCDRAQLRARHSYGYSADISIGAGSTASVPLYVPDDGLCSRAGVQLDLNFAVTDLTGYGISLTGPDGTTVSWSDDWTEVPFRLYGIEFAGKPIHGIWTLSIFNGGAVPNTLLSAPWLFAEGIGPGQSTGGAVFHWGVYADPDHLGENGEAPDFQAAEFSIQRIKHSHAVGSLVVSKEPWPGTTNGFHAAIPGRCTPA